MKKYIAPILISILIVAYALGMSIILFVAMAANPLPIWAVVMMLIAPIGGAIAIVTVMIMRIKEIKGGEEDEASKY